MRPDIPRLVRAVALASLDDFIRALGDPAWIVDPESGRVLMANVAAEILLGRGPLEDLDAHDLLDSIEDRAWWEGASIELARVLESDSTLYLPGGPARAVTRRIAPLTLAEGTTLFLVQVRDRTREQRIEAELEAAQDALRTPGQAPLRRTPAR
jgi:PAS domain-containing protein